MSSGRFAFGLLLLVATVLCAPAAFAQPDYGQTLDVKPYRHAIVFKDPYATISQEEAPPSAQLAVPSKPGIIWQMDTTILMGMQQYADPKRSVLSSEGYRVQIYNGDRDGAINAQYDFMELQTGEEVYMTFEAPNFKVRVGNFAYEDEARTFSRQLQRQFSGAYVVPAQIQTSQE